MDLIGLLNRLVLTAEDAKDGLCRIPADIVADARKKIISLGYDPRKLGWEPTPHEWGDRVPPLGRSLK